MNLIDMEMLTKKERQQIALEEFREQPFNTLLIPMLGHAGGNYKDCKSHKVLECEHCTPQQKQYVLKHTCKPDKNGLAICGCCTYEEKKQKVEFINYTNTIISTTMGNIKKSGSGGSADIKQKIQPDWYKIDGKWHHIVTINDRFKEGVKERLYIDGKLVNEKMY